MTETMNVKAPADWNPSSYLTKIDPIDGLKVADWVTRLLLFRKAVRRSMTNGQYIAYCDSHEPIRP